MVQLQCIIPALTERPPAPLTYIKMNAKRRLLREGVIGSGECPVHLFNGVCVCARMPRGATGDRVAQSGDVWVSACSECMELFTLQKNSH